MSKFRESFHNRPNSVFVIAIHVRPKLEGFAADLNIARGEGADGIIVIRDYETPATNEDVLEAYTSAREKYPRWWIGINLLGYRPDQAVLHAPIGVSGVWTDHACVSERTEGTEYLADVRRKLDTFHLPHEPLLLPSVAMKYQEQPKDLALVTRLAAEHADVIITSGDATGVPADASKVKAMRAATKIPLGLASGVSAENVRQFIELGVNMFIVNTSISTDGRLDARKVGVLRDKIPR